MPTKLRSDHPARHRILQLLHHVGWAIPSFEEPQSEKGIRWQLAPLPDGQALLFVYLSETLPSPDTAFRHYEDFSALHRRLFGLLRERGIHARHALLVDGDFQAEFVDLVQEDLLVHARNEAELTERILPLLTPTAVARNAMTSFPRKSPRQRARELDDWTRLWSSKLGAATGASRDLVATFFQWLHLARLAEQSGIGKRLPDPLSRYGEDAKAPAPVRRLLQAWKPLSEQWMLLQGTPLKTIDQLARHAQDKGLLLECLRSYGRLSRSKFSSDIFAEAFSDEDLRATGWRHALVEAAPQPSEATDGARWLSAKLDVDLDVVGFPGLLASFNQVAEELRLLARHQAVQRQRGERPGVQLDLLGAEPPPLAEEEAPRYALQHVLRVTTASRTRAETARMVLLAHAAEWFARLHRPDAIFPVPHVTATTPAPAPELPRWKPANPNLN